VAASVESRYFHYMRRLAWISVVLIGILLVGPGPLAGQAPAEGSAAEEVPLYTNEDLDKYGPPSGPDVPVAVAVASGDGDWRAVQQFLDREYARLDAERRYELEREALRLRAAAEEERQPTYLVPWAGVYGYPYWSGCRRPHRGGRPKHPAPGLRVRIPHAAPGQG
jgi:hypothetical protein